MVRIAAHSQQHHSKPWPRTHGDGRLPGARRQPCLHVYFPSEYNQTVPEQPVDPTGNHASSKGLLPLQYEVCDLFWFLSYMEKQYTYKKKNQPKQPALRKLLLPYCSRRCSDLICWHLSLGRETSESPTRKGKLLRVFKKAYIKQQGWREPISPSAWDTQYS